MWYKLTTSDQSSTLSVGKHLITKDARFSVAYYSVDHGFSPAKWDLHITNVRLSDAAQYQCHVITKDNRKSIRSNVKLIVEGKTKRIRKRKLDLDIPYVLNVYMRKDKNKRNRDILYTKEDNQGQVKISGKTEIEKKMMKVM